MAVTALKGFPLLDLNQSQPHVPIDTFMNMMDLMMGGMVSINLSGGNHTLSSTELQNTILDCNGHTVARTITINQSGFWIVFNEGTGPVTVSGPGGTDAVVQAGCYSLVFSNGSNFWGAFDSDRNYSKQVPTTGFSITIGNDIRHLILDPAGTLATGTITMAALPVDGQRVEVSTTATVTGLTVSANAGQSIKNAPTTLAAGGTFAYRYVASNTTWYRAG